MKLLKLAGLSTLIILLSISSNHLHNLFLRTSVGKKVVMIHGKTPEGRDSGGTGFYVKAKSGKTYIMTNNHVCNLADTSDSVKVLTRKGKTVVSKVLVRHKTHDLCLVTPVDKNIEGLSTSSSLSVGDTSFVVGHPALRPLSLSKGEIVGNRTIELFLGTNLPENRCFGKNIPVDQFTKDPFMRIMFYMRQIRTVCIASVSSSMFNGIAYGGNSGSPVVNYFGSVVGVLFAGSSQVTDVYLVPLDVVNKFLEEN